MYRLPYQIVYILSLPHSGSTLLTMLLNAHASVVSLGEISQLRSYAQMHRKVSRKTRLGNQCTCGAATIYECPFWSEVCSILRSRNGKSLRDLDLESKDTLRFREDNRMFFDAVTTVSGAEVIVDSSKGRTRFVKLCEANIAPIFPIYLMRDPRGQVYSMMKRNESGALLPAAHYFAQTLKICFVLYNQRAIRMRYESIATRPKVVLSKIMSELELTYDPDQLNWAEADRHNLGGNVMRIARDSRIEIDEEWHLSLSPMEKLLIYSITFPARLVNFLRS